MKCPTEACPTTDQNRTRSRESATSRVSCDVARRLVFFRVLSGTSLDENRGSIDGSDAPTFFPTRSRAGHVARPDSARFVAAFDVFNARRRQLRPFRTHAHEPHRRVRHTHPAQSQTCASLTPAPRASRPSSAPRATSRPPRPRSPSSRRRNASTPPNKMRGACAPETPLRHANATPTNATRANPPAGTRERTTSDRRRRPRRERRPLEAARCAFPARASADGSGFSADANNRSRPRHAPETARARSDATARAPRARSTPSLGRSRRRDATAAARSRSRHLLRTTRHRDETTPARG